MRLLQFRRLSSVILFVSAGLWSGTSPALEGFQPSDFVPNVVDTSGTLSQDEIRSLNQKIGEVRQKAGIHAAVYLVTTLDGDTIDNAAWLTFKKWELGEKGHDNGILMLFAMQERKARIEVGYGLEGVITDVHASRVLNRIVMPDFKRGAYASGIEKGLETLAAIKTRDSTLTDPSALAALDDVQKPGIDVKEGLTRWGVWLMILFLTAPILKGVAYGFGKKKGSPHPIFTKRGTDLVLDLIDFDGRSKRFIKIFFTLNPGLFIFVSGLFLDASLCYLGLALSALLYGAMVWNLSAKQIFSERAYRRGLAYSRLFQIRTRVTGRREVFGKVYEFQPSRRSSSGSSFSSSSSSSSSSFSSSSGGGRSGGGGASSGW